MKVARIISEIKVIGNLWMPGAVGIITYPLGKRDIENIKGYSKSYSTEEIQPGTITREGVEQWLVRHAGDFQSIIDFSATIGDGEFDCDWEKDDSFDIFCDGFVD